MLFITEKRLNALIEAKLDERLWAQRQRMQTLEKKVWYSEQLLEKFNMLLDHLKLEYVPRDYKPAHFAKKGAQK